MLMKLTLGRKCLKHCIVSTRIFPQDNHQQWEEKLNFLTNRKSSANSLGQVLRFATDKGECS